MAALVLPVVLGFVALSVEYGRGLLIRSENQRVADIASYAAALAYGETNSEVEMEQVARSAASHNGVAPEDVAVELVASPRDPSGKAVRVSVATLEPLFLAPILGVEPEMTVAAQAFASIGGAKSSCIVALDEAASGVTLSGGVRVSATTCTVASNAGITAPCGTTITAESASYYSQDPAPCPWTANIVKADGSAAPVSKQRTEDPLLGNSGVTSLHGRFDTIRKASWPKHASVRKGPDVPFGSAADRMKKGNQTGPEKTAEALADIGCTYDPGYYNKYWTSKWVITCSGTEINIGSLELEGNVEVSFNADGKPDTVYNFSGSIVNRHGTSIGFGPGTFNVAKGIHGAAMSFGAGIFHIGMSDEPCGSARYSLCSGGTLRFEGPSTFVLDAGLRTGDGATLSLGSGSANSYVLGSSSNGNAISIGGGSKTYMADATASGGLFRLNGNVDGGGGGSCIELPASKEHDILGNVHLAGGARLGAGVYAVDGYFVVDTGGADCSGSDAVSGKDVTIVISGIDTPSNWACKGQAFCLDGGNAVTLAAPASGPYAKLAVIGPQSPIVAGATITSGGRGAISGAFYFPLGPIIFGGGGKAAGNSAGCLQLIGASVTLSGGAQTMSECIAASGGGKVALIQ